MTATRPLWASLSKPIGKLYKLEWYWCDKQNNLQSFPREIEHFEIHYVHLNSEHREPHSWNGASPIR